MRISDWSSDVFSSDLSPLPKGYREHFDGVAGKRVSVPVYARRDLQCEQQIMGPALIAEDQATTFVSSYFDVSVDRCGNLVMDRKIGSASCRDRVCQYV